MNPAIVSLIALILAIILSMFSRLNIGILAIALAWVVGVFFTGMKPEAVMAGFPATLFLTLTGVTLLFSCAETNDTLKILAHRAVRLVRGNHRLLPIVFFALACLISSVGPGAIPSVALVVPLAMVICTRAGVAKFLTALMVANGANAGNLSPTSSVGVIANTKMTEGGIGGHEGKVWFANFIAHVVVAAAAYFVLSRKTANTVEDESAETQFAHFSRAQIITVIIISLWIVGVLFFKVNVGLSAFAAALILIGVRAADESQAISKIPWSVVLMVCGVSSLVAILEKTGGLDQFTALIARIASPQSINGIIAFMTGLISTYSSTSGVVLPAFLPIAPKLVQQMGGGDPLAIALSINVGSSIVDVSPLSTLGALCLATVKDEIEAKKLFRQMMIWGFSMMIVGGIFCWLFAGILARL